MPEVSVSSLDARVQKQVENAQVALQRGNYDYVIEVTSQVLKGSPGCLPVRRLQRAASIKHAQSKNRLLAKTFGSFTQAGFLFGSGKKDPVKGMENAEKLLTADPLSIPALKLLAESASGLDLPETAAFAWECIRDQQPKDRETLLALGEAYLAANRPKDALAVADALLQQRPQDGDSLNLMRKASVAQTTTQGNWEAKGSFRDKLKDEAQAVSLEQASKVVTSDEMTQRLIDEALVRVRAQPDSLNHYRSVIEGYRRLGKLSEALAWTRKARELPVGAADSTLEKQVSDLQAAILEARLHALEAEAAAAPDDEGVKTRRDAARAEFTAFRVSEAKAFVERYPNDYGARFTLANLYFEAGDYQPAIANYQQALKNPKVRIQALAGMGRALKARRMFDLAVAQFQMAKGELTAMDDLKKDVIYQLAECYEAMGKTDLAIEEFKVLYSDDIGFRDVADKINAYYASR